MAAPKICFDRVIPPSYNPARADAHTVAMTNFAGAVLGQLGAPTTGPNPTITHEQLGQIATSLATLSATSPVHIARMAVIDQKKWPKGTTLRCRFLDGSATQKAKVEQMAHEWEKYCSMKIVFGDDPASEVRISFVADPGSWSAIGNDCLVASYFPAYQPTMNFGWLRDDTDDLEYQRVVVHEFGHALGCIHEHQSPNETLSWNTAAVYASFSGPPNYWSQADIDTNILQKYSPEGISATRFDMQSIMLYQFDGSLFTDGKPTPNNTQLSPEDEQMIGQMYPA
jgi:hypothetical protein